MTDTEQLLLLKKNFQKVEEKFISFFEQGVPRWPGEKHDLLRNHHKSVDDFSMKNLTIDRLRFSDLPENIMTEITLAFNASRKGEEYK